ncbi:MopE-related protein [Corallococcus interemptor]|uniref:MopE-related protein n=1 Tax=Corallococcus interemptor TaxID=2316720 RepID=UPI003D007CA4
MKRLFLLLPLVALAGCKDPQDGVKVTVSYSGFVPACVRVTARNGDSDDTRTTEVAVRGTDIAGKGQVVVGIRVPDGWGPILKVTAAGLEQAKDGTACGGKVVTDHMGGIEIQKGSADKGTPQQLALSLSAEDKDGDGYVATSSNGTDCNDDGADAAKINPGATELCNNRDDNCDGVGDKDAFMLETPCEGAGGCGGTRICDPANAQQATCNAPTPTFAWIDADGDNHGQAGVEPRRFCPPETVPSSGYVPFTGDHDDCNDNNANVRPGAPEVCDGLDNNCDGTQDNLPFEACTTSDTQCAGKKVCDGTQGATKCEATVPVPTWYPDGDGDDYGSDAGTVKTCVDPNGGAVKYVNADGDCDDGNPFIHANAPERCDSQDNNCNGSTDENNACPANAPRWDRGFVGGDVNRTWLAVSTYGDAGVWIAGENSGRAVKEPSQEGFSVLPGTCTDGSGPQFLPSVWADPTTGIAYMGRDNGQLIVQAPDAGSCTPRPPVNDNEATTRGLMGFATAGGVNIHGVGRKGTTDHGFTLQWDGGTSTVTAQIRNNNVLSAVHGLSESVLFAAGVDNMNKGVIYRYDPLATPNPTWKKDTTVPSTIDALTGIHVVSNKLAYAVSDAGKLLQWTGDGTSWTVVSGTLTGKYRGVLAFGKNSIYIATDEGTVLRYNGSAWSTEAAGGSKYGISGTSPDNIWVVGRFGQVTHYPSWPAAPPDPQ